MRRRGEGSLSENQPRDPCATLFDDSATLTNAEEWLLQADYTRSKTNEPIAKERYESVIKILFAMLPEVHDIRVQQPKNLSQPPQALALMEYGWVPLQALSSGYRTVTAWMVDLASRMFDRYPDVKKPLEQPAIVLVDQIDLHLHPRWQRELIDQLSKIFKNTQFIVTAHSPLIVQAGAAVGANVVVLRREGDHVTINNSPTDVRGWRLDQIVSSDLFDEQPSRDEPTEKRLQARRTLLAKAKRTAAENRRLAQLEKEIGPLPTGESREDIEAMALIRRAADKLRQRQAAEKEPSQLAGKA